MGSLCSGNKAPPDETEDVFLKIKKNGKDR